MMSVMGDAAEHAGDQGAVLLALYDRALPQVYGYLQARTRDAAVAEDLTAETFLAAVDAVQRGAFDYLTKPFLRDELRAKIGRALASRRWARDRERLLAVGQTLASSGIMARVLDAVAQGAVETTEAERCVVFQQEHGRLVPMASSGSPPPSWPAPGGWSPRTPPRSAS